MMEKKNWDADNHNIKTGSVSNEPNSHYSDERFYESQDTMNNPKNFYSEKISQTAIHVRAGGVNG